MKDGSVDMTMERLENSQLALDFFILAFQTAGTEAGRAWKSKNRSKNRGKNRTKTKMKTTRW